MTNLRLLVATLSVLLLVAGCKGDPNQPAYWEKALSTSKSKKDKLKKIDDLRDLKALDKSFLPMLHTRLAAEKNPEVKAALVVAIGGLKDPSSVDPLIDAFDWAAADRDAKDLNKKVASALSAIGDAKAVPALIKCLALKDDYTVIAAIEGLGQMKAKEAVDQLINLARSEEVGPFISKVAIQALGDIGDPKATDTLIQMMFKERRGASFYVESSFALYQVGNSVTPQLLGVLEGTDKARLQWAEKQSILPAAMTAKVAQVLGDLHENKAESGLLNALKFNHEMLDIKLFVRMKAADALGRLRSAAGGKALAGMLEEEEATARDQYARALVHIGGRDAIAALVKSAGQGSWDARESVVRAVALLGDEREAPSFAKWAQDEEKLFSVECKEDPQVKGCSDVPKAVKAHTEYITKQGHVLNAAKECKTDAACWEKKLDDADSTIRMRAAHELARSKNAASVGPLMKHLREENLDTRLAIIFAIDWLIRDNKEAGKAANAQLSQLDAQIAAEKGKTEFQRVNEDLRRLAVTIRRS